MPRNEPGRDQVGLILNLCTSNITIRILTGDSGNCLFSDADELVLVPETGSDKDRTGYVYITPASNGDGTLPHSDHISTDHYCHQQNLKIAGAKEARRQITMRSGSSS